MNDDQIRRRQEQHSLFGPMYLRLYTFARRVRNEFFFDVEMPMPVLSMERDNAGRAGSYEPEDSMGLAHRINLNPFEIKDGNHAAEILCHEMLHMWEHLTGQPTINNIHNEEFHERMFALFGIRSEGHDGKHTAHDVRWDEWLDENADLKLGDILFPGMNKKPPRRMFKHTCPECGATFHARKKMNVACVDHEMTRFLVDESNER